MPGRYNFSVQCHKCDKWFGHTRALKRHIRDVHDSVRVECPYDGCVATFAKSRKDHLDRHIRDKHRVLREPKERKRNYDRPSASERRQVDNRQRSRAASSPPAKRSKPSAALGASPSKHRERSYSPVNLHQNMTIPRTNCNRNYFCGKSFLIPISFTGSFSLKIGSAEIGYFEGKNAIFV